MVYTYAYPRPALTVDALVVTGKGNQRKVLLIRRGRDPFAGMWALPGGFVDMEETLEAACRRELKEETGLDLPRMEQFRVFDAPGRDPRHRTISVVFHASVAQELPVTGGDDASLAAWYSVTDLPPLAFDHSDILSQFLGKSTP